MSHNQWYPRRLDELGFVGRGKSRHRPRNDARLYGGPYPFIQTADIMAADPYITTYSKTYSDFGIQQSKMWPANTLCITIAGANTAKTAILRFDACFPDSVVGFIPDSNKSDIHFIKYSLDLMRHRFLAVSRGATQDNLSLDKLLSFPILVPELDEQRRIAGILSAYDELIENSQQRIKILETMARALYREWFVHFRFPGHESVPRVPSALGEIPQGWEVKKLGDITEEMRRNVAKGKLDEPQPYVGLEHIPRRSLALDAWEMTTELGSNKLEFKKGEVLFGKIRPYFHKVSVAPFDGLCSADTIVVRARRPEYYAFVVACVSSDEFVAHATATSNGSKMPRANWGVLEERGVVIPKGKLAGQFTTLVSSIIDQQQALVFQIQNLRRTRDLLLPRLLAGQMRLQGV
jgi:type I restriction enzyme S subunit